MKKQILIALFFLSTFAVNAQESIKWMTFEQAITKSEKSPKKIFVDVYTDWCGWCKKMDNTTFSDPVIIAYMNQNFYAVKLDAEGSDTVVFQGNTFVNPNPGKSRSSNQLAQALLQGKMSYPSYVIIGEDQKVISVVPGYYEAKQFEPVLNFFGKNAYQTIEWTEFNAGFKGSVK